jgi:mannose-6-phosphate isomerase-like protein (cupin superfamily)
MTSTDHSNEPLVLLPGEGRRYPCGTMTAIFKADEEETREKYSISEWWLDPHSGGPGIHQHENNDEVFYVLEGSATIFLGDQWITADTGSFIRIPAKSDHDFENRTDRKVCLLNFFIPGGFERNMPAIVQWFDKSHDSSKK